MARADLVVASRQVVTPQGLVPAAIVVRDGTITAVGDYGAAPDARVRLDAGDAVVFPGLVDSHVHVNEPGRTEWEGFETATRAAAAGGVTTILDMPLNSIPPTTTVSALEIKRAAAQDHCAVDVGFLGGLVPGSITDLGPLYALGAFAFKCFLCPSGVDEFPPMSPNELRAAAPTLATLDALLMVHAEWPAVLDAAARTSGDPRS